MKTGLLVPRILLSIGVLTLLGGCARSSGRWGRVVEPAIGTPFAEFTYVDTQGRPQTLAKQLGDFTILAFTKCGSDLHGSVAQPLAELVQANQEAGTVKTVGFDVHWSEAGCTQGSGCHLIRADPNLYSICDAKDAVRRLYGADARNQVFVIGPDHRIVDKGSVAEWDALQSRIQDMVREYGRRERSKRVQESG